MEGTTGQGSFIGFLPLLILIAIIIVIYYKSKSGGNSGFTEPRPAIFNVVIAGVSYLIIGFVIYGLGALSLLTYLLYIAFSTTFSYSLLKADISELERGSNSFKRISPFENFGASVYEFQYSFKSENEDVIKEVSSSITDSLENQSGFSDTKIAKITDKDKKLEEFDSREFILSRSEATPRGGNVSLLIKSDNHGSMFSIKWWFLLSGYIDSASIITFVAFAPLSMPFWISPRLSGTHNLASRIRRIYPAFYESHDLFTIVNCANKLTMETLISELESRGIDTSDLKTQQAQAINISVSGGKTSFGSIVQGSSNSVNATGGGSN